MFFRIKRHLPGMRPTLHIVNFALNFVEHCMENVCLEVYVLQANKKANLAYNSHSSHACAAIRLVQGCAIATPTKCLLHLIMQAVHCSSRFS